MSSGEGRLFRATCSLSCQYPSNSNGPRFSTKETPSVAKRLAQSNTGDRHAKEVGMTFVKLVRLC
jgi:hypothetical protein